MTNNGFILIKFLVISILAFYAGATLAGDLTPPPSAVDSAGNPQTSTPYEIVISTNQRFKSVLNNEAILDKQTGIIWENKVTYDGGTSVSDATSSCINRTTGGRVGWRSPTDSELASVTVIAHFGSIIEKRFPNAINLGTVPLPIRIWTSSLYPYPDTNPHYLPYDRLALLDKSRYDQSAVVMHFENKQDYVYAANAHTLCVLGKYR